MKYAKDADIREFTARVMTVIKESEDE